MPVKLWPAIGSIGGIAVATLLLMRFPEPPASSAEQHPPDAGIRAAAANPADTATGSSAKGIDQFYVWFEKGLLTVRANRVPLGSLMKEVSRQAYVAIQLDDGIEENRITVEFAGLTLEEGLRQILSGYDVFSYHRGGKGLLTLWVYGELEGRGLMPIPADTWASTADLQEGLEDADPEERAATLQSLLERGGRVSEQQVIKALDDESERVRTVALYGALNEGLELPQEKLADLAANDLSHNVRFLALRNLAGQPGEMEAVDGALSDPNPVIRSYAESTVLRLYPSEDPPEPAQLENSEP